MFDKQKIAFFQLVGPVYYLVNVSYREIAKYIFETCERLYKYESSGDKLYIEVSKCCWPMFATKFHFTRIAQAGFPYIKKEKIEEYISNPPCIIGKIHSK